MNYLGYISELVIYSEYYRVMFVIFLLKYYFEKSRARLSFLLYIFTFLLTGLCSLCKTAEIHQKMKSCRPISRTTPLSTAELPQLITEVKSVRAQLRVNQAQLQTIQNRLVRETVQVDDDIKVCVFLCKFIVHVYVSGFFIYIF